MSSPNDFIRGRDSDYGKPRPRHRAVVDLYKRWQQIRRDPIDPALEHAVYMILDKLTRIAVSPLKEDSWIDIQGYAECALESVELLDKDATLLELKIAKATAEAQLKYHNDCLIHPDPNITAKLEAEFDTTKNCLDMKPEKGDDAL